MGGLSPPVAWRSDRAGRAGLAATRGLRYTTVLDMSEPWKDPGVQRWCQLLLNSHRRWVGCELGERNGSPEDQARALFEAPFVVVSHGVEADPVLNFGNRAALELWETTWEQFTQTPSRRTAEPVEQAERARMLAEADARGFIENYRGVRVSMTGRRFLVDRALVWNVVDADGRRRGQAATFGSWTPLPGAR